MFLLASASATVSQSFERARLLPSIIVAAAAFVVAQSFTWDGYYGVAETRYIQHGSLSIGGRAALVGVALVAAVFAHRRPSGSLVLTAAAFAMCAFAQMLLLGGH